LRIRNRKLSASLGAPEPHVFAVRKKHRSSRKDCARYLASIASRFQRP
jgi:hypothetical protein